jgi:hypothetical protein
MAATLDRWLRGRLVVARERPEALLIDATYALLSQATRVDATAARPGISRRDLSRVLSKYLRIGAATLVCLHRFDRRVRTVQAGASGVASSPTKGHQLREWRRRLGTIPGRYGREGRSPLVDAFGAGR